MVFSLSNYNINSYEVKRDLITFSKKVSKGLSKQEKKYVVDTLLGMSKSVLTLISNIARSLNKT